MPSVGERPKPKSFKHKMKTVKASAAEAAGRESTEDAAEAALPAAGGGEAEAAAPAGQQTAKKGKGARA